MELIMNALSVVFIIAALLGLCFLVASFLGWAADRHEDDKEQMEYLSKYSYAERAKRDMRALRGAK